MSESVYCANRRCGWRGTLDDVLRGKSPFDDEVLIGCPKCKTVDNMIEACDEPGCWKAATCGTPTPSGYRRTCGDHWPNRTTAARGESVPDAG